jgi:preprotein translocase subunit YajC
MHILTTLLAATTTTAKSSKSSGSSSYTIIFLLVIVVAAYFLLIRPRQQRARQAQATARQIAIGDEVVSAGGIYGRVVSLDTDSAEVEVAPGVVMRFLRRAISIPPAPRGGATPGSTRGSTGSADAGYEEPPGDRPDDSN